MKIEDIIESLNKHIEDKRVSLKLNPRLGHLVLQKTVKPHETFKAYKEYNLTVWFIKGKYKYKTIVINHIGRVLEGHEDIILNKLDIELCNTIFKFIDSDFYKQIVNGEYIGGLDNETIKV